ncbi:MAG: SHOCT domain-containing protein, partial [Acidimicrobiales bacterium]
YADDTPPTGTLTTGPATGPAGGPAGWPGAPRPAQQSVAQKLAARDELRRRGILTEAEFAAKKADLLDRL